MMTDIDTLRARIERMMHSGITDVVRIGLIRAGLRAEGWKAEDIAAAFLALNRGAA